MIDIAAKIHIYAQKYHTQQQIHHRGQNSYQQSVPLSVFVVQPTGFHRFPPAEAACLKQQQKPDGFKMFQRIQCQSSLTFG